MFKKYLRNSLNVIAARFGSHRTDSSKPHLWILMYHRIIPEDVAHRENEEPGMFVTPETFGKHMKWLNDLMPVIQLEEWCQTTPDKLPKRSVAITFDDGWHDNYSYAFPILKKMKIPATIFLVSHLVNTNNTFWPNRLARVLNRLSGLDTWPDSTNWLDIQNTTEFRNSLTDVETQSKIINQCKSMLDTDVISKLEPLESDLGLTSMSQRHLLNWEEINEMKASGLIDFGSHTCHHYRLNDKLSNENIKHEIIDSWKKIEKQTGSRPTAFCYPNGDRSVFADEVVRQNYSIAVTTHKGINQHGHKITELDRIGLHEDISQNKNAFMARLANWR